MAFEVVDEERFEERFNGPTEGITGHREQLKALGRAIELLDVLADGGKLWLEDSRRMVKQL